MYLLNSFLDRFVAVGMQHTHLDLKSLATDGLVAVEAARREEVLRTFYAKSLPVFLREFSGHQDNALAMQAPETFLMKDSV